MNVGVNPVRGTASTPRPCVSLRVRVAWLVSHVAGRLDEIEIVEEPGRAMGLQEREKMNIICENGTHHKTSHHVLTVASRPQSTHQAPSTRKAHQ